MTRGRAVLVCALACGIVLRVIWPADMEWKADEQRMFTWASTIGITEPWPPIGMASGVAVPNPGLSVWLFVPLARATRDPVALAQVVQVVNVIALVGFVLLGASRVIDESARRSWFAGLALMSVDADVSVSIDGESASDSASTDRSNMVYGIGGEFSFSQRFGVRLSWDRYAEVGSDELAGEVDIDLISLGLRYNFD